MSDTYDIAEISAKISWKAVAAALESASDAIVRLDERMARDEHLGAGVQDRGHFREACATLWLQGELVHLEDLVLHVASMDVRAPSAELVRAASIHRTRKAICRQSPKWALSREGIAVLRGRRPIPDNSDDDDGGAADFKVIDALIERSSRTLETTGRGLLERVGLLPDEDWNEDGRLAKWLSLVQQTEGLPPLLAAAFAWDAWIEIDPLHRQGHLGVQLVAALLRARGKTRFHLATLNLGIRTLDYRRRPSDDVTTRILSFVGAAKAAADAGMKDLNQLTLARQGMERRSKGKRSNSRLPELIGLFLSSPIVNVPMAAKHLKVSQQAVEAMIKSLGTALPRELTGRSRFRAWGIF